MSNVFLMSFEQFISRRISFSDSHNGKMATSVVRIAVGAVTLGVAVMLISLSVVKGFKQEVYNKIIGVQSHITIKNRDLNLSFETSPIIYDSALVSQLKTTDNIRHIQAFATKPAIVKSDDIIQGIVLKGVDADFDPTFFRDMMKSGKLFNPKTETLGTDSIVISQKLSNELKKSSGDTIDLYSLSSGTAPQNMLRARRFIISGVYQTGLDEADAHLALCKIRHVRKLYDWDTNQISGLELFVNDFNQLDQTTEQIRLQLVSTFTKDMSLLLVNSFKDNNPQIVDWLSLSDLNIAIIIGLMSFVAIFQMIAGMLVIILERTPMIGILKTLGANNKSVRRIFVYNGSLLLAKGIAFGNILAYGLLGTQYFTRIMPLNPDVYYTDAVPVLFSWTDFVFVNIGTFFVSVLSLLLPAIMISGITPAKTIKFE